MAQRGRKCTTADLSKTPVFGAKTSFHEKSLKEHHVVALTLNFAQKNFSRLFQNFKFSRVFIFWVAVFLNKLGKLHVSICSFLHRLGGYQ